MYQELIGRSRHMKMAFLSPSCSELEEKWLVDFNKGF